MRNKYIKYLSYVLIHKWYVFIESCKMGIPILGIIHDISKLSVDEFIPYANFFYGTNRQVRDKTGYYKPVDTGDEKFELAWLTHARKNKHHWQYWVMPISDGSYKCFNMPDKYRREMFADWVGAGRAQGHKNNTKEWYLKNKDKMLLHRCTREWVEKQLGINK